MTMPPRAAFAFAALIGAGLTALLAVIGQFGPDPDFSQVSLFAALPTAALLLAERYGRLAGLIRGLVGASSVFMLAMLGSAVVADGLWIGVAERLLLGTGVLLLGVLAAGALRSSGGCPDPARSA